MPGMDLDQALREAPAHIRNAEEAKGRKIPNVDFLYMWDNQVAALDNYLADTEPLAAQSDELQGHRRTMRELKRELEKQIVAFEAAEEGEEPPSEEPSEEDMIPDLKGFGQELLEGVQKAAKKKITDVKKLDQWEEPVGMINSFLADSEPLASKDEELAQLREELRGVKNELDEGIARVFSEWRAQDIASSNDG